MIQVTKKYGIEFDEFNIQVLRRRQKGKHLEEWDIIAYYPNTFHGEKCGLQMALARIADAAAFTNQPGSVLVLEEIVQRQNEIQEGIRNFTANWGGRSVNDTPESGGKG